MIRRAFGAVVAAIAGIFRRDRASAEATRRTVEMTLPDAPKPVALGGRGSGGGVARRLNLAHLPHPLTALRKLAAEAGVPEARRNRWARNLRRLEARHLAERLALRRRRDEHLRQRSARGDVFARFLLSRLYPREVRL